MENEEIVIGFFIDKVFISKDRTEIVFENINEKKYLNIIAKGWCCSESWFEHTENVCSLPGSTIIKLEELDPITMPVATRQVEDKVYGYKFYLEKNGSYFNFIVEMRNSDNGYYGGTVKFDLSKNLENFGLIPFEKDI